MDYKLTTKQIIEVVERGAWTLFDYCKKHTIHYVVTGSSGGMDSALTLGFAQRACQMAKKNGFRLTPVGLIMPCESKPEAERLGRLVIKKFGAKEIRIDLSYVFRNIMSDSIETQYIMDVGTDNRIKKILEETGDTEALGEWGWSRNIAQGNIKARLRMIFAYHVARMMKGMVLSTDNLSEWWMAFWTICGDVGDFGIIQKILKGLEIYDIARYLGVPQEIIDAKPDDGLGVAGGDEEQLGAPYPVLDMVMINLIQKGFDPDGSFEQLKSLPPIEGVDPSIVKKLAKRCLVGSYKRKGTIVLSREELGLPPIEEIRL